MRNSFASGAEPQWAAFAAIDWANQKNYWQLLPAGSKESEQGELENTSEAVEAWAVGLAERFGGRPIAVCLEQSRGPLVWMLAKYPHLVLFPVHPTTAARYRQTFAPSGAKADPSDTASLLDLLLRHREKLHPLRPDTPETRLLQFLVEERRQMVDEKTRFSNRLKACLKMYFPQVVRWFDDVSTPMVGDLLERWPRLESLQRAHPGTLRRFFHEHNSRSEKLIEQRIESIQAAVPATTDKAVLEGGMRIAAGLLAVLATLREQIAILDKRIAELVADHPDAPIFESLPGAGKALAPRLLVAFGTQRDRYESADDIQRYSGIAPVKEASGNSEWVHFRFACPKFVRQTFHEFAAHSIAQSKWAKAFYDYEVNENHKEHHAAVRALAFKWIRIIFRCWQDGKHYDEQIYVRSIRRRNALLKNAIGRATPPPWITVAGFSKLA